MPEISGAQTSMLPTSVPAVEQLVIPCALGGLSGDKGLHDGVVDLERLPAY